MQLIFILLEVILALKAVKYEPRHKDAPANKSFNALSSVIYFEF